MKTSWLTFALLVFVTGGTQGQVSQPGSPIATGQGIVPVQNTPYAVVERGANQRVWQRTTFETTPTGKQVPQVHKYTELATGLCYQQNGQWADSKEKIDILPNGTAAATQGQHQAYFPGDIYQGMIGLVTPDGKQLQSRPVGLSYDDGTNTVLIGELQGSPGAILGNNQVIYTNAFTGLQADLLYTYRKGGFEQEVILRQQPPSPESFGLNFQTARLQLLTEFFGTNNPVQTLSPVNPQDGLSDTTLAFGQMKMAQGKAFSIGNSSPGTSRVRRIPVYKSWLQLQGRTILVEEVPYRRISSQLQTLPAPANAAASAGSADSVMHKVSVTKLLPPARMVQASTNAVQLAKADLQPKRGVVLDYAIMGGGYNSTFQADTTYFVSGGIRYGN